MKNLGPNAMAKIIVTRRTRRDHKATHDVAGGALILWTVYWAWEVLVVTERLGQAQKVAGDTMFAYAVVQHLGTQMLVQRLVYWAFGAAVIALWWYLTRGELVIEETHQPAEPARTSVPGFPAPPPLLSTEPPRRDRSRENATPPKPAIGAARFDPPVAQGTSLPPAEGMRLADWLAIGFVCVMVAVAVMVAASSGSPPPRP